MTSVTVQDYLKAIYQILEKDQRVSTSALAGWLQLSSASVTNMLKKLAELGFVEYEPYRGVLLTESGEQEALAVLRHHRLAELYLAEVLGMPWDEVHEEADKWEHVLSREVASRMAAALGQPTQDPHGAPIPTVNGQMIEQALRPLSELQPGARAVITRITDRDPALLRYLGSLGLYPQVTIEVLDAAPFGGPITLRTGDRTHSLGLPAASQIFVELIEDHPRPQHTYTGAKNP